MPEVTRKIMPQQNWPPLNRLYVCMYVCMYVCIYQDLKFMYVCMYVYTRLPFSVLSSHSFMGCLVVIVGESEVGCCIRQGNTYALYVCMYVRTYVYTD